MSTVDHGQENKREGQQFEPLKLTEAEIRVLRECRVNSLYLRGLPLGLITALGTRYLANNYFPHVKRWAGFYYTVAFGVGLTVGVASYKDKCFNKIMSLENSHLAEQVRNFQRRAAGLSGGSVLSTEFDTRTDRMTQEESNTAQPNPEANSSVGIWKPPFGNDTGRLQNKAEHDDYEEAQEKRSSYEELRRMHRSRQAGGPRRLSSTTKHEQDDAESQSSAKYDPDTVYDKRETYSTGLTWDNDFQRKGSDEGENSQPQSKGTWPQKPRERKKTNKYGDEME